MAKLLKEKKFYIVETYRFDANNSIIEFGRRQYKTKTGADKYCAKFADDDFYKIVRYELDEELPPVAVFDMLKTY